MPSAQAYTHDPAAIIDSFKELEDGSLLTLTGCKIYAPVRYAQYGLAFVGVDVSVMGSVAVVVGDKYGVILVNSMVSLDPVETNKVKFDNEDYYEFVFQKASTVIPVLSLVKRDVLTYRIYEEFISKGHVPWYMSYEMMGNLFDTAKEYANANIGGNSEVTEIIASLLARNPKDKYQYYRQLINTPSDLQTQAPAWVGLSNVIYAATNTFNRLAGAYMQTGMASALVNPAKRVENIENMLL